MGWLVIVLFCYLWSPFKLKEWIHDRCIWSSFLLSGKQFLHYIFISILRCLEKSGISILSVTVHCTYSKTFAHCNILNISTYMQRIQLSIWSLTKYVPWNFQVKGVWELEWVDRGLIKLMHNFKINDFEIRMTARLISSILNKNKETSKSFKIFLIGLYPDW